MISGLPGTGKTTLARALAHDLRSVYLHALRNLEAALREAGASLSDVVRVRYLLPRREDFELCWPVLRRYLGEVRPAATMQVCGLADEAMRVEIEATAYLAGRG